MNMPAKVRLVLALVCGVVVFTPHTLAARPADKGPLRVESFGRNVDGSYAVGLAGKQTTSVWVAQVCEGSAEYQPVPWGGGMTADFQSGDGVCEAYVAEFPDVWTPISEVITFG